MTQFWNRTLAHDQKFVIFILVCVFMDGKKMNNNFITR